MGLLFGVEDSMILYIWLLWHEIVIFCQQGVGCLQVSNAHFNYLIGIGALELIFEIPAIIKVFFKKDQSKEWPKPEGKNGLVSHTKAPKRRKDDK
jgi:hypothetical protein